MRGLAGVRRATIDLDGFELKVGIAHGLGNARHLLEDIRNGHNEYHVIEIMACPGGCIGGGGQPLHHGNSDVLYARANALYREDANKPLRKSHENPYIKTLYEEYLGKPLSETAEHLLHTLSYKCVPFVTSMATSPANLSIYSTKPSTCTATCPKRCSVSLPPNWVFPYLACTAW